MREAQIIRHKVLQANALISLNIHKRKKKEDALIKHKADGYYRMNSLIKFIGGWVRVHRENHEELQTIAEFQEKQAARKLLLVWNSWGRRARRNFSVLNRKQTMHFRKLERKAVRKSFNALWSYSSKASYLRKAETNFIIVRLSCLTKAIVDVLKTYADRKKNRRENEESARKKYEGGLMRASFAGLACYANNKKYLKEKREELD